MPDKIAKDRPTIRELKWKGIPIALEYAKGQVRHGVDLPLHYGYFPDSSTDDDGDHVDVFIDSDPYQNDVAFIINQVKQSGAFDEHKVILGPGSAQEAKEAYLSCYKEGWTGFGSIVAVTPYQLEWWLERGDTQSEVSEEDFLPGGKAAKRAFDFTPDYTVSDLARFGLLDTRRKTAWLNWYEDYARGVRTDRDSVFVASWKKLVRKAASQLAVAPTFSDMEELVKLAVDPFPFVDRAFRKRASAALLRRWQKYAGDRKPIVAIDVDGTLCETMEPFDNTKIGPVKPQMVILVNALKKLGCTICIWTVRSDRLLLTSHLKAAGVEFDYINDSPFQPEGGSNKIYADVYLDDRAVRAEGPVAKQLQRILDILRIEGLLK